jgi:hypothetical protein
VAATREEQPASEPGKKKRRRRRRRGKSSDEGETETETDNDNDNDNDNGVELVEESQRVSQDEIIIDIDEQELTAVRDEFGEIDEFDELTLKGRRRAVLEDLTEEMEVEDLTDRDAEDEDDEDGELESEPEVNGWELASSATPALDDGTEGTDDGTEPTTDQAADSQGRKKKRRRRRRKKTPAPAPELTCPPHKDFWEVWAAKFSAKDFQRDEDSKDSDETVEDEPAPVVVVETLLESEIPLIEDAPDEDSLVRVGLNIGRRHGHKAAHVRALLRRLTGLHGKAVKDLTVRDRSSLFRMDIRHFETVVARLDGSVVEQVSLTLVHLGEDSEIGEDGELPSMRAPAPSSSEAAAAMLTDGQPVQEIVAAPEDP